MSCSGFVLAPGRHHAALRYSHRLVRDILAEIGPRTDDPIGAPAGILLGHLHDQRLQFRLNRRAAGVAGLAPDENVLRWQHRLTPAWKRIAGGCHLDRPVAEPVRNAGSRIDHLETGYTRGPKPMTFINLEHPIGSLASGRLRS